MAEYLASIFGTEKDKVNCTFYFKIGACRHGETCTRIHNKPTFSQTIVLVSMYKSPAATAAVLDPAGLGCELDILLMCQVCIFKYQFVSSHWYVLCSSCSLRSSCSLLLCLVLCLFFNYDYFSVSQFTDLELQDHFDTFFEDVFVEVEDKYGKVTRNGIRPKCWDLGLILKVIFIWHLQGVPYDHDITLSVYSVLIWIFTRWNRWNECLRQPRRPPHG